ncbi:MAG: hypothetical protein VXZ72_05345 [Chlamydiota bacterium]|nr:hypothetical protein [Chlamydiota bacterium]
MTLVSTGALALKLSLVARYALGIMGGLLLGVGTPVSIRSFEQIADNDHRQYFERLRDPPSAPA